MLMSSLLDYGDAYILVGGTIAMTGERSRSNNKSRQKK